MGKRRQIPRFRLISAAILTLVVTLILVLWSPPQAKAVTVSVTPSANTVTQGTSITFTATVQIQSNERIPIQNAKLHIYSDSGAVNELTYSPYSSPRTMSLLSVNPSSSYGYGYGYGYDAGQPYSFGYGYGYAGSATLTYQCTVATSTNWTATTYYARAHIDAGSHVFKSSMTSFTVVFAGGGGVGGGGGAPPSSPSPTPTVAPTISPTATPTPTFTPGPPPTTTTPSPTVSPTPPPEAVVEDITDRVSEDGVTIQPITIVSADGATTIEIPKDTLALDEGGNPLTQITVQPPTETPPVPPEQYMIAILDFGPDGATFNPPISITMTYDPDSLPPDVSEKDLVLAYYDESTGEWVELPDSLVDTVNHTITATTDHFTPFAVLSKAPAIVPSPTETTQPTPAVPEEEEEGVNIWIIIGPIIAVVIIGLLVFLEIERRRGTSKYGGS